MPAFLPPTMFQHTSILVPMVCVHILMGRLTPTTPETKLYFISAGMKSNVIIIFFMAKRNLISGVLHLESRVNILLVTLFRVGFFIRSLPYATQFSPMWNLGLRLGLS